jgi:hypothetical protein
VLLQARLETSEQLFLASFVLKKKVQGIRLSGKFIVSRTIREKGEEEEYFSLTLP